ncbi:MAG TPA: hypothetical protein VMY42_27940 [Thermoguttaceae bacterium]|nr:hypothetical protein [Thermoguttaceae bacterium]
MRIDYRKLRGECQRHGPDHITEQVKTCLAEKVFKPEDFSFKELAEEFLGHAYVRSCDPRRGDARPLREASDAVDVTAFSNITGQLLVNSVLQGFENAPKVASTLVSTIPTRLNGEKVPGVERITDEVDEISPGMPYPNYGFGETYINTPDTAKRGLKCSVTKEAIYFDLTGQVLTRAGEVGQVLATRKEKRVMDMIIGYGGGATPTFAGGGLWRYKGTDYDVYNATAVDFATYWYLNQHTAVLTDYTDIDEAELLFSMMQQPDTREPVEIMGTRTLLVPPALRVTANRIINTTEIHEGDSDVRIGVTGNPISDLGIRPVSSAYMYRRLIDGGEVSAANAKKHWLYGDFAKAFAYMENWPITVVQSPPNSYVEFNQDIVIEVKASERGACAVINPYYVTRSTGAG